MTKQCNKCKRRFKLVTKEGFCMMCYKLEFGKWTDEFTAAKGKGGKGK